MVAQREDNRATMAASLQLLGVEAVLLAGLGELAPVLRHTPASGILLEVTTFIMASPEDKRATQDLIELFPFIKFKIVGAEIRIVSKTLAEFVEECLAFEPRTVRLSTRIEKSLAVCLSRDGGLEDAERATTLNVSEGGCFVVSVREWKVGGRICLLFPGIVGQVWGTVRSWKPWGNNNELPGIGVKLDGPWSKELTDRIGWRK